MKRVFDLFCSTIGIIVLIPIFLPVLLLVYIQDFRSPLFIANRTGKNFIPFKMIKIRSMIVSSNDGFQSTSSNDPRITQIGYFIRKFKLDELSQLVNVCLGQMSLVGPRPNVKSETDEYTDEEKKLLSVKPGITDFSSIVFSDEGEILKESDDPDLDYNQLIRPWKSRLGIFYIENRSFLVDLQLIFLTVVSIFSKQIALNRISKILFKLNADGDLIRVCRRVDRLVPCPPPGMETYVTRK